MKSHIISIGDELLRGLTVNTNAAYIAHELLAHGYSNAQITTIGDGQEQMKQVILDSAKDADLLVITGGLGPTADDLTRQVLSGLFKRPLEVSEVVKQDLEARYGVGAPTLEDQSVILEGAKLYLNPLGSAPGFLLEEEGVNIVVLPGPPSQMQAILPAALTDIQKTFTPDGLCHRRYLSSLIESEIDPFIRQWEPKVEGLSIGVCPDYGFLSVYFWAPVGVDCTQVLADFEAQYEGYIYSSTDKALECAVIEAFKERGKTLTAVESCTGGLCVARLTDVPGASDVVVGGWVSYSNKAKQEWLGVDEAVLEKHGAVSLEVAHLMAQGGLKHSGANYALSITGIAGPSGGTKDKPVGTVCVAIAGDQGQLFSTRFLSKGRGDRLLVKTYTVNFILSALLRVIKEGKDPF